MRSTYIHHLFTLEGVIVAAVTLTLTLLICWPRKSGAEAVKSTIESSSTNLVEQFRASMEMNHQRWHDGTGYDLSLIAKATPEEHAEIESLMLRQPVSDWRIVEGLSHLRTPAATVRLQSSLASSRDHNVKMAITQYAGDLISPEERTTAIISALREAPLVQGLHRALQQIPDFHPREIIHELHQATLKREGDVAVHCAALLLFLHGKSGSIFDSAHRIFLSRFATKNTDERAAAHQELCEILES